MRLPISPSPANPMRFCIFNASSALPRRHRADGCAARDRGVSSDSLLDRPCPAPGARRGRRRRSSPMLCTVCNSQNEDTAETCFTCGTPLAAVDHARHAHRRSATRS